MTHKSTTQPHCLWCGKRIAKRTTRHDVKGTGWAFKEGGPIVTREDLQKRTNGRIVSVKYHYENERHEKMSQSIYDNNYRRIVSGQRTIHAYSTWDGESYVDPYFCNGDHARCFAYAAAKHGLRFKKKSAA